MDLLKDAYDVLITLGKGRNVIALQAIQKLAQDHRSVKVCYFF